MFQTPSEGIVACTRHAMSANKKPFGTGEFGRGLATAAFQWLGMNGWESETFQEHMAAMVDDLNMHAISASELHAHLKSSIGRWNVQEVKTSRFFDWPSKFHHFVKQWTFLSLVYKHWRITKGEDAGAKEDGGEEDAGPSESNEGPSASLQGKRGSDLVKALKDMQKSRHTLEVAAEVLEDLTIKKYASMIYFYQQPFANEYQRVLKLLHEESTLTAPNDWPRQLQVTWANCGWARELGDIFSVCSNREAMQKLGFMQQLPVDEQALQLEDSALFGRLLVRAAAQRGWTMAQYSETAPENWSGILASDRDISQRAFSRMKWRSFKKPLRHGLQAYMKSIKG